MTLREDSLASLNHWKPNKKEKGKKTAKVNETSPSCGHVVSLQSCMNCHHLSKILKLFYFWWNIICIFFLPVRHMHCKFPVESGWRRKDGEFLSPSDHSLITANKYLLSTRLPKTQTTFSQLHTPKLNPTSDNMCAEATPFVFLKNSDIFTSKNPCMNWTCLRMQPDWNSEKPQWEVWYSDTQGWSYVNMQSAY